MWVVSWTARGTSFGFAHTFEQSVPIQATLFQSQASSTVEGENSRSLRSPICHFAFRTDDFDGALATLTAGGFREDAAEDDPMRVMVRRNSPAGFPQLYLLDPTATSSRSTARRSQPRLTPVERAS